MPNVEIDLSPLALALLSELAELQGDGAEAVASRITANGVREKIPALEHAERAARDVYLGMVRHAGAPE